MRSLNDLLEHKPLTHRHLVQKSAGWDNVAHLLAANNWSIYMYQSCRNCPGPCEAWSVFSFSRFGPAGEVEEGEASEFPAWNFSARSETRSPIVSVKVTSCIQSCHSGSRPMSLMDAAQNTRRIPRLYGLNTSHGVLFQSDFVLITFSFTTVFAFMPIFQASNCWKQSFGTNKLIYISRKTCPTKNKKKACSMQSHFCRMRN